MAKLHSVSSVHEDSIADRLYDIAYDQDGLLTAEQAHAAGVSTRMLSFHARAGGTLVREGRGLYRLRRFPEGQRPHVWEAWLPLRRAGALVSHSTALDLYGLSDVVPDRTHLTLPAAERWRRARPGTRLHFVRRMPAARSTLEGLAAVEPAAAIAQALDELDFYGQTERTVRDALERHLATPEELRAAWPARDRHRLERLLAEDGA